MIRIKVGEFIDDAGLSRNAVAREAKIRSNAIYEMASNETKRLDLETFNKVIETLRNMTGRDVTIADMLEYTPDDK